MANFNFLNLTDAVRQKMVSEIESDIENNKLYLSNRLNSTGKKQYPQILKNAAINNTEVEMAENLIGLFNETEQTQKGIKKIAKNAPQLLSQGEFNRFYIRAVCLEAIETGKEYVEIYRGRQSSWARAESEAKIGSKLNAQELLSDLRKNIGVSPKILPEVNSGLTVKLV